MDVLAFIQTALSIAPIPIFDDSSSLLRPITPYVTAPTPAAAPTLASVTPRSTALSTAEVKAPASPEPMSRAAEATPPRLLRSSFACEFAWPICWAMEPEVTKLIATT